MQKDICIFLIDDNPTNIKLLSTLLISQEGFTNVHNYNDPVKALADFYIIRPQLILLDINMPVLNGIAFLHEIQKEIQDISVSVLILSANNDEKLRLKALNLGAIDYISKPFNVIETLQKIKNVLTVQHKNQTLYELSNSLDFELQQSNETLNNVSETLKILFNTSSEYVFIVDNKEVIIEASDEAKTKFNVKFTGNENIKLTELFNLTGSELQKNNIITMTLPYSSDRIIMENKNAPLFTNDKPHHIYIFKDITQQIKDEENLKLLAQTHYISKLPNRHQLENCINKLNKKIDSDDHLTFVFITFCENNKLLSLYGPKAIQQLQLTIANLLRDICHSNNATVLHWSSNEYLIICAYKIFRQISKEIILCFENSISSGDLKLHITPSLGYFINKDNINGEKSVQNASTASYESFTNKQTITQYDFLLKEKLDYEKNIETILANAISNNVFFITYQPIINLAAKNITGAEALIRWQDNVLGMIPPDIFIPIAERAGLIVDIGNFVIEQVFCDYYAIKEKFPNLEKIAINVASPQLNDEFIDGIKVKLRKYNVQAHYFKLEITETSFLDDFERVNPILWQLKELGFSLAIDDFGTGFSSLSYLLNLPVDTLKIDRAFILPILTSSKCLTLVKSIISMSHSLDLTIVAEGIEDIETSDLMKELGVQSAQGYYYGKPETL